MAQRYRMPPRMQETWVRSLGEEDPLEKERQPNPVSLPGKPLGQRSLAGYSPWGSQRVRHDLVIKQVVWSPARKSLVLLIQRSEWETSRRALAGQDAPLLSSKDRGGL